jgi:hypothetical protein
VSLEVELADGLRLALTALGGDGAGGGGAGAARSPERGAGAAHGYPTGRLQRGLLLADGPRDLAEEGVGFGVPVLKLGTHAVFPGGADVTARRSGDVCEVEILYRLDLVERLAAADGSPVTPAALYAAKDALAALHRRQPAAPGQLSATSSGLRPRFGWVTTNAPVASLPVRIRVDAGTGRLDVSVGLDRLPPAVTEVAVMNEQGARAFDRYEEPGGPVLHGRGIGTWDLVGRPGARFVSRAAGVAFALDGADGATVRRGRELIGARLAWAGFGLSVTPPRGALSYTLSVGRVRP